MTVRGTIGKLGLVPPTLEGANITANLLRISPNRNVVRPHYLFAFLSSSAGIGQISAITSSTTISTFRAIDFQKLTVPIPPLYKQDRFVTLAFALRTTLATAERAGTNLRTMWDLILERAFSGKLTARWREAHIKELTTEIAQQGSPFESVSAQ